MGPCLATGPPSPLRGGMGWGSLSGTGCSMTDLTASPARSPRFRLSIDKLGVLIALLIAGGWVLLPLAAFKANRIDQGQGRIVFEAPTSAPNIAAQLEHAYLGGKD